MYARINTFTPRCDQEAKFAWELELSDNLEFKGATLKGMFESLAEVLKIIEDNNHFIVEA